MPLIVVLNGVVLIDSIFPISKLPNKQKCITDVFICRTLKTIAHLMNDITNVIDKQHDIYSGYYDLNLLEELQLRL
jgi:hypothetical protein